MTLRLPRNRLSVTVARHIVRQAMEEVGVHPDCAHDIELSVSEACTNALLHSGTGEFYDVRLNLEDERCKVRVVDVGYGFSRGELPHAAPGVDAERGRGVVLMTALVDRVRFVRRPHDGTVVSMEKELVYADRSLLDG